MKAILMALLAMTCAVNFAQIGIGPPTPDASFILDIQSASQGILPPGMTSSQKTAITSPANGLMVFDTTPGSLYYYDTATTSRIKSSGEKEGPLKYIKSTDVLVAEKTAGSNTKCLMDTNTLYEINGTIIFRSVCNYIMGKPVPGKLKCNLRGLGGSYASGASVVTFGRYYTSFSSTFIPENPIGAMVSNLNV